MRSPVSFCLTMCLAAASFAAELKLGKPLELASPMTIEKVLAEPDALVGKQIQVKGKITEVCQMMGCWMALRGESGQVLRVKVNDGEIVFPKDSAGKTAIAEGKLTKRELTRDQAAAEAKHEAEEQGRKFDPASVKAGKTVYQIQGSGAVILN
ncbi:MAG: DUF4920 domain-containing protein [Bryobacteraceae bacterium]|nr:DUF4920 domain-containing protein [Bryobacteraceae bacterium]